MISLLKPWFFYPISYGAFHVNHCVHEYLILIFTPTPQPTLLAIDAMHVNRTQAYN